MRENETLLLKAPTKVATSNTGAYVDLQGYVNPGGREIKFVLSVGAGTTAGTAGGYIQSAEDTASTGVATVCTFATQTSAGGDSVKYGVVPASHRYVRLMSTTQTGKNMYLACHAELMARVSP